VSSGKVRFGYWEMAFLGPESEWAAQAGECAADQDAFWPFHDKLFESQSGENGGAFATDKLKTFAADLGLDTQTFDDCLDAGKYATVVQEQTNAALAAGVNRTPTIIIGGVSVGLLSFEEYQQIIEAQLSGGG